MCGICGYYGTDNKSLLERMRRSIVHRGPDDHGLFLDSGIGLASNRLSIIDLKGGHQPMSNENEDIWIAFVGEIYNYKELREELRKKHSFRTKSDTEVIIHAYEEFGYDCVKRFNGMFSFAIWDSKKKQIFIARDRFGIKPMYYTVHEGILYFASEIKAILQNREIKREVDLDSMDLFFSFRYDAGPRTIYKGIKKLMPGHYLLSKDGKLSIRKYWDIRFKSQKKSEEHFSKEILELFRDSIKRRLQSEVPLGVFLSGGIDSCAIVAMMKNLGQENIQTFTLGFNQDNDEIKKAREISQTYDTDHHELFLEPDSLKALPKLFYHMDEPHADTTIIPMYYLTKEYKRYATVVLTGEGSDEVFAGYEQYRIMKAFNMAAKPVPKSISNGYKKLTRPDAYSLSGKVIGSVIDKNPASRYVRLVSIFSSGEKKKLYSKKVLDSVDLTNDKRLIESHFRKFSEPLDKMQYSDLKYELPQLIMKVDKMAMANAVEPRVPYLDHRIMETVEKIPARLRLKGFNEKYILRKAFKDLVPKSVVKRKKQRFFTPIDSWFNKGIKEYLTGIMEDKEIMGFFNKESVDKMLRYRDSVEYRTLLKHNSNSRIYYSRKLWNILAFGLWYKAYMLEEKPKI